EVFIDYNLLKKEFNIISYYSEANKVILIKNKNVNNFKGEINKETFLYKYNNIESVKINEALLDDEFIISKVADDWYYGYNENLEYGYIKKEDLKNIIEVKKEKEVTVSSNDKIIMTWEQIYSYSNARKISEIEGLNVISPTWYKLISDSGDFSTIASENYINSARDNNYKIWPLVSNTFGDIEMTSRFLNNSNSRKLFIENLLMEFEKYEYEGINIDFENIYMKDKDKFTQFISELSYEFSKKNIIVSVDVTVMGGSENWSLCYNRKRISELVDYLVIMTYDEHWASSKESGSVASYNWVNDSLNEIIEIVDSEKIIMGIPFFTRIWYEVPSTTVVNQMDVTSKTITLKGQRNLLGDVDVKPIWDDVAKQFFISYIKDSKVKKVWLEEEVSIKEKVKLVNSLNLAGVAMWSRGFETENIWKIISDEVGDL
ncbi:glycosyl hydrolase family 18 protein, partial [Clostridiaceae bacterium HSG29]|nr:glycosyl hydrolase family 18 protein [Clostridiaceae bacterium HSG29]